MKKIIIGSLAIMMLFSAQLSLAQKTASDKIDHLKTELNLSEKQVAELEKIFEAKHEKMKTLKSTEYKSEEEKQAAMRNFRQSTEREIEGVLSADQMDKFREINKEHKGNHGKGGKGMGQHNGFKDGNGKEFHSKMKAYQEENIKPVMLVQRAKLEPKISVEDQQIIAGIRADFEKQKAEKKARFGEMRKNGEGKEFHGQKKTQREGKEGKTAKDQTHHEQLNSLVDKYKGDIQPLFDEVADQQAKWDKDIKAISESTLKMKEEELEQKREKMKEDHGDQFKMMKMSRFLLLDPNEKVNSATTKNLVANVNAFPNPASAATTIEYEVLEDGEVQIELRDNKGNQLKSVKKEFHKKGKHQVTIALDGYNSDLFYVVIQDKNGVATTKNIVRMR